MAKKKIIKPKVKTSSVNEPSIIYGNNRIKIFKSFEEQADYELKHMAKLSSEQILQQMRKFINIAYGMHGFNPNNLPTKHFIKILLK